MSQPHTRCEGRCARCRKHRSIHGRGLCKSCHRSTGRDGSRASWPRTVRTTAEVVELAGQLRAEGLTWDMVAARLSYSSSTAARTSYYAAKRRLERAA